MAEDLHIDTSLTKEERYASLLPQLEGLVTGESDTIANMANVAAALRETFGFWWVGFYLVQQNELVLGPFQGPVACTRIQFGKGVCGSAWKEKETLIVPDVEKFPGHIACSSASRSEIVVPGIMDNGEVKFVLDIDSELLHHFDKTDQANLSQICNLLIQNHFV